MLENQEAVIRQLLVAPREVDPDQPPTGSRIGLSWDAQCLPVSTNLLYGSLDQLSGYGVAGALCGFVGPATWESAPGGDLWFLLVSDDGAGVESSWGVGSGGERNGLAASGYCGVSTKNPTGSCP